MEHFEPENDEAARKAAFIKAAIDEPDNDVAEGDEALKSNEPRFAARPEAIKCASAEAQSDSYTNPAGNASENALKADALKIGREMVAAHLTSTPLDPSGKGAFLPAWNKLYVPRSLDAVRKGVAERGPNCNVGNINGAPIDDEREWFLVDGDIKASKDGKRPACTLAEYMEELASTLAIDVEGLKTVMALSGSGGPHLYFWAPRGTYVGNKQYVVTPRTEFPQQIVAPGSRVDGREYAWADGCAPGQIPFKRAPQPLIDAYLATTGGTRATGGTRTWEHPAYEPDQPDDIEAMREWLIDAGPNGAPHAGEGRSGTGKVINMGFLRFNPTPETLLNEMMAPGGWNETKTKTPWALDGDDSGPDGDLTKYVYDQYESLTAAPGSHNVKARAAIDGVFDGEAKVEPPTPEQRERMEKAVGDEWPEPMPLPDALAPVAPFDLAFLPDSLAPWVADIAERMQCPIEYVGISALVALGSVLGRKAAIRPQRKGTWFEHVSLWAIVVGHPGSKKTPAMGEAMGPLRKLEDEAYAAAAAERKQYEHKRKQYEIDKKVAEKQYERAIAKDPDTTEALRVVTAPAEPVTRRYRVDDTSYEALGEILIDNPNGVLAHRDEIITLLKQLGREENATARGFYLTAWGGRQSYTFDRIGRGTRRIEGLCLSVLGSTQPGILADYVKHAIGSGNDGMLQRFGLLVWPDPVKEWRSIDREPDEDARLAAWQAFRHLDTFGDWPEAFTFDDAAQRRFSEWLDANERRLRSGELPPHLCEHFSKYGGLVPSLALLNHLADGGTGDVGVVALDRAIGLVGCLETHARRAHGSQQREGVASARALLRRIQAGEVDDGFTARAIYRRCWGGLTDKAEVAAAIQILVDRDWLVAKSVDAPSNGGRPSFSYSINPKARA